jgi:hypothetical protein
MTRLCRVKIAALAFAALTMLLATIAGTARAGGQSAAAFAVETTRQNLSSQYGLIWAKLHPAYRTVTTRAFWESCQRKRARSMPAGFRVLSVRAIASYPDRPPLPLLGTRPATAVTLRMAFTSVVTGRQTVSDTIYVLKRPDGGWWGTWQSDTYRAYKAHRCPSN